MDLIDRDQAIEVADAIWTVTGDKNVAKVWQQLQDLPSAEKTGKWTLFKDKVPPETGRYFITLDLGYAENLVSNDVWISLDCEWSVYDNEDVIAWMPIEYPERYKEGD